MEINLIINMKNFVNKNIFFIPLLLLGTSAFCQRGSKLPFTFPPPLDEMNIKGRPEYINYVLGNDIADPKNNECKASWDIFFFRVNGSNKVDSIRHEGNLPFKVTNQIIYNINSTQGRWKIPLGTKKKDYCWFIYPYFRIPSNTPNCNKTENILLNENIYRMARTMDEFYRFFQGSKYVVILNPEYGLSTE